MAFTMQQLRKPFLARKSAKNVLCSATTTVAPSVTKKASDIKLWKPINLTKNNLTGAQGGETTRNIDGVVYYVSYDAPADLIVVVDRKLGVRYPAAVDDQNRVRIDTASPVPHPVPGFSPEAYAPVLRADAPGAEIINGRVAMAAFLGLAINELITSSSVVQQFTAPAGGAAAAALGLAVLAASVAPALAGRVAAARVLPDENDPYVDRPLPYTWTPLAEKLNGRVAMVGLVGLVLTEQFARGGAALL